MNVPLLKLVRRFGPVKTQKLDPKGGESPRKTAVIPYFNIYTSQPPRLLLLTNTTRTAAHLPIINERISHHFAPYNTTQQNKTKQNTKGRLTSRSRTRKDLRSPHIREQNPPRQRTGRRGAQPYRRVHWRFDARRLLRQTMAPMGRKDGAREDGDDGAVCGGLGSTVVVGLAFGSVGGWFRIIRL